MCEFKGHLYAGTLNVNKGFEIWKTTAEGQPPYKWKKVITQGAYRGRKNQMVMTMLPFKDRLYVGSAIQDGGFDIQNRIGPAGVEIIRINPDDSWELVVGDPRVTPEGLKLPLSGLVAGFGSICAGYLPSMAVHEGRLYAGTADWLCWLQWADRSKWPKELSELLPDKSIQQLIHSWGGFDLWRSDDGCRWMPITRNGFSNQYNISARTMASTPYGLAVGAINSFGPDVAVRRMAGWNYESNPRGGLEIWFGSSRLDPQRTAEKPKVLPDILPSNDFAAKKLEQSAPEATESIIDQFYRGSRFRHVGFWQVGVQDARAACENLMDEILAFAPEKQGTLLEIGCDMGATTHYLSKYFPPEAITAITNDKKNLKICRKMAPHVKFLYRKLPKLKLPSELFDSAIWVKGWHHLGPRADLLRETFRVLKPGGRLNCFDALPIAKKESRVWKAVWSRDDSLKTLDEYRELLLATGFSDVRLIDVTNECLEGFREHTDRFLRLGRLSGAIDDTMVKHVKTYFQIDHTSFRQCLLISGRKEKKKEFNEIRYERTSKIRVHE